MFRGYDDRHSHFSRRLVAVQQVVAQALAARPPGPIVVMDVCGGAGHALLPVLAEHPRRHEVRAFVIDHDAASVREAAGRAAALRLPGVEAALADAGLSDAYVALPRAHVIIVSGVLVHLSPADRGRLVRFLGRVAAPGACLIWTIGWKWDPTRIGRVRRTIVRAGCVPLTCSRVPAGRTRVFRSHEVGIGLLPALSLPVGPGERIFRFRPSFAERHPRLHHLLAPLVRRARHAGIGARLRPSV